MEADRGPEQLLSRREQAAIELPFVLWAALKEKSWGKQPSQQSVTDVASKGPQVTRAKRCHRKRELPTKTASSNL